MNARPWISATLFALLAIPAAAVHGPPVLETPAEFFASGDFNGRGLISGAVLDRASGGVRFALCGAPGVYTMPATTTAGVTDVDAVAVGRFLLTNRDSLAITAPAANRIRLLGNSGIPVDAGLPGVGPRHLTGIALPGGSSGFDDLIGVSIWNWAGFLGPYWRSFLLNQSTPFLVDKTQYPEALPHGPLAVVLIEGDAASYADLQEGSGELVFRVYDISSPAAPVLTQIGRIATGSRAVFGTFHPGHNRSLFVFHAPGSTTLQVSEINTSRQLGTLTSHTLPAAAAWVHPVHANGSLWLAASSLTGQEIHLYSFNNSGVPVLAQTLKAPKGSQWNGVIPASDNAWLAAFAPAGDKTATLQRFAATGGSPPFAAGTNLTLADLRPEELACDVVLFAGKPFVENQPVLRGRHRAGGWTSQLNDNPQFPASMTGVVESWRGAPFGLGNPATVSLGSRPAGVTHGLPNQIAGNASFYSLDAPLGALLDEIVFDPPPGPQTAAIEVELTTANPASTIRYCLGDSFRWTTYIGPLGPFDADTTIRAYVSSGDVNTPVQSATYTFPAYSVDLDSDDDGVPDFVEKHHGLDPLTSRLDGDSDGCPDLQEILLGTNPADPTSVPPYSAIRAHSRHFQFGIEPRSHGGTPFGSPLTLVPSFHPEPPLREGTWVTVHRPDGTLEFEGNGTSQPGGIMLTELQRIVPDPPFFWVGGTPNRFMIDVPESDQRRGRAVYRLLDYSAPPIEPLPRPALSGSTANQVNQWITAIRNHLLATARVTIAGPVSLTETLDLLLAEHALGLIFHRRGWMATPKLSLTPFRGDARSSRWIPLPGSSQPDRLPVRHEWLTELGSAAYGDDGYDWAELLQFIRTGTVGNSFTRNGLDELARDLYFIGYHAYDDPDDPLMVEPFDALRQFLDSGTLPADYTKRLNVPESVRTAAANYLAAFDHSLPERPHTSSPLVLVANPGFFQAPWIVLQTQTGGVDHWLADPLGQPLPLPGGFRILPGCRFLAAGHLEDRPAGGAILRVNSISLLDAPLPAVADSDGNLLGDDWEAFYYGILANEPFGDTDGDGYHTLQEMFENADPRYAPDRPAVPALDLRPPRLALRHLGNKQFDLSWNWPARYHDRVRFSLEGSPHLRQFETLQDDIQPAAGDLFQMTVDAEAAAAAYFFRVGFRLR